MIIVLDSKRLTKIRGKIHQYWNALFTNKSLHLDLYENVMNGGSLAKRNGAHTQHLRSHEQDSKK